MGQANQRRALAITAAVVLGSVALATSAPGQMKSTSSEEMTAAETTQLVAAKDPTNLTAQDLTPGTAGLTSDQGALEVTVPVDAPKPLTVDGPTGALEVSVPGDVKANVVGDTAVFKEALPGVDVVAQAVDGGVRQVFVLDSAKAQTSISFTASSAGSTLVADPDGAITVSDPGGTEIAGINRPWAVGAAGKALPTSYSINGDTITQHIDVTAATYPVTADPTICGNKIDRVWFGTRDHRGRTMFVRPTGCGRWFNGSSGWQEAQREGGQWYSGAQGRSMKNQFICHFDFAPFRATWNLDEWRPDVGYWTTVRRRCNP